MLCYRVGSATAEAERLRPDVVLLDVRLPDGTGFQAGKQIQKSFPDTRVLITVKNHLSAVLEKLQLTSRTQAAAFFVPQVRK